MAGSSDNSGSWLMTYADFITLMMIFFIVLYTFTPGVEKNKFEAIIGAFQGKRSVLEYESVFSDEQLDIEVQRAKNWDEFKQYVEEENLSGEVQVELMEDGVRITLGESVTFDTYSAALKARARVILTMIGESLKQYTAEDLKEIEIQGHTDNRPIRKDAVLYTTNWELGAARATSVLDYFVAESRIAAQYFKASTYGPYRPRAENNTERGRQQNRRVVIYIRYIMPEKQPEEKPQQAQVITEHINPMEQSYGRGSPE